MSFFLISILSVCLLHAVLFALNLVQSWMALSSMDALVRVFAYLNNYASVFDGALIFARQNDLCYLMRPLLLVSVVLFNRLLFLLTLQVDVIGVLLWCQIVFLSYDWRCKLNSMRLRVLNQLLHSWNRLLVTVDLLLYLEWALLNLLRLLLDASIIFHGFAICPLLFWGFLRSKWSRRILAPLRRLIRLALTVLALILLNSVIVKVVLGSLLLIALALLADARLGTAIVEATLYGFEWVKPRRVIDLGYFFLLFFILLL